MATATVNVRVSDAVELAELLKAVAVVIRAVDRDGVLWQGSAEFTRLANAADALVSKD
jgi:hypothetical protein